MTSFKDAMWIAKYNKRKTMSEEQQIEEILQEANAYNLKWEIETQAKVYIKEGYTRLKAYNTAYMDWIK